MSQDQDFIDRLIPGDTIDFQGGAWAVQSKSTYNEDRVGLVLVRVREGADPDLDGDEAPEKPRVIVKGADLGSDTHLFTTALRPEWPTRTEG